MKTEWVHACDYGVLGTVLGPPGENPKFRAVIHPSCITSPSTQYTCLKRMGLRALSVPLTSLSPTGNTPTLNSSPSFRACPCPSCAVGCFLPQPPTFWQVSIWASLTLCSVHLSVFFPRLWLLQNNGASSLFLLPFASLGTSAIIYSLIAFFNKKANKNHKHGRMDKWLGVEEKVVGRNAYSLCYQWI